MPSSSKTWWLPRTRFSNPRIRIRARSSSKRVFASDRPWSMVRTSRSWRPNRLPLLILWNRGPWISPRPRWSGIAAPACAEVKQYRRANRRTSVRFHDPLGHALSDSSLRSRDRVNLILRRPPRSNPSTGSAAPDWLHPWPRQWTEHIPRCHAWAGRRSTAGTIRTRLLEIAGSIRVSTRKIWVSYTSLYPWKELFQSVASNLAAAASQRAAEPT